MSGKNLNRLILIWALCFLSVHIIGCLGAQPAPRYPNNLCEVFRENRKWYRSAHASYRKWGIPIPVMMAIMHQESRFKAKAKPPRTTCLCILPGPRLSSAYGYAQALDGTWDKYKRSTGNSGADRDDFADSIDFIGWYGSAIRRACGIARNDAYNLYLAYHEGRGGFLRKTYTKKRWLQQTAKNVEGRARKYKRQLASCEREFQKRGWCCLWPF